MSSMAIRIWIALNFLTVFLQYFLQYFFASFFECFITTALRSRGKGERGKGCTLRELLQPFCILMAHFASLAQAAIILPLLGNFVDVASFPMTLPPHLDAFSAPTALFRNVLLPRQFMLLSFAPPDWRTCNGSPFAKRHTHTRSFNALPQGCRIFKKISYLWYIIFEQKIKIIIFNFLK